MIKAMTNIDDKLQVLRVFADIQQVVIRVTPKRITTTPPAKDFDPNAWNLIKSTIRNLRADGALETCPEVWASVNIAFKREGESVVIVYKR
jgi:hypothetical protein